MGKSPIYYMEVAETKEEGLEILKKYKRALMLFCICFVVDLLLVPLYIFVYNNWLVYLILLLGILTLLYTLYYYQFVYVKGKKIFEEKFGNS
jgi:1,4-dihydroxy-2-naphthoate octaprenyltransferase